MPRPCAVACHVRGYKKPRNSQRCHGLAPWSLTLAATKAPELSEMPRPCAVECHVRGYKKAAELFEMPRPCAVESHARSYTKDSQKGFRMPRRKGVTSEKAPWLL